MRATRREFFVGMLASAGVSGCAGLAGAGAAPRLRFGVVSDIHVTTPESTDRFRAALRYFRSRGADAVVVAGDLSDWGLKSGLRYVADAWRDEMSGAGVVPLFCTGNHDYDGWWYGDMTLDMHLQGYSEAESLNQGNMKSVWESTFGEPFAAVRRRTVKGYDFVSAEWQDSAGRTSENEAAEWLRAHAGELGAGGRPFFFFRHDVIPGTVASSEDRPSALRDALSLFPNGVAFCGHTHWPLTDERSIWQGGFTAVSIPSMSYTALPAGYDNGDDRRNGKSEMGMRMLPLRENYEQPQGYFVSVYDGRVVVERHDFGEGEDIAAPWDVCLRGRSYSFAERSRLAPVPQFAPGARVGMHVVNGSTRNDRWTIFMRLEFPAAKASQGRAFDYEVRVEDGSGRPVAAKRFLTPTFHRAVWRDADRLSFDFDGWALPESGPVRFAVYPRNCFGVAGRPAYSPYLDPKPGRAEARRAAKKG